MSTVWVSEFEEFLCASLDMGQFRRQRVEMATSFLRHANASSAPLRRRVEFLRGKGLDFSEIEEALDNTQVTKDVLAFLEGTYLSEGVNDTQ